VYLVAALDAEQRRQHADRPGPGDQRDLTQPGGAGGDRLDLLPRLGHDAAGLGQHTEVAEPAGHLDGELRLDPPAGGAVAIQAGDTPLAVLAVRAEIPLTGGAGRARYGVRAADHPDHQVTGLDRGVRRGLQDPAQGFVPDDQAMPSGRRPPVAGQHLTVGRADADQQALRQDGSFRGRRIRHVGRQRGAVAARDDAHRLHGDRTYPHRASRSDGGPARARAVGIGGRHRHRHRRAASASASASAGGINAE
jgi:hypothetical protein